MQLDERRRCDGRRTRCRARVADPGEFVTETGIVIGRSCIERLFQRKATDVDQAAEHVGREAGTFLVGEERNLDRPPRDDAVLLEGLDHL